MNCYICGSEMDEGAAFCPKCGTGNPHAPEKMRSLAVSNTFGNTEVQPDDRTTLLPSGSAGGDDKTTLLPGGSAESDDKTTLLPGGSAESDDKTTFLPNGSAESDDRTAFLPQQGQPPIPQQVVIPNQPAQNPKQQTVKKRKKSPVKRSKAPIIAFLIVLAAAAGAVFYFFNPNKEDALQILSQANAYYDSGDYSAAEAEYNRVLTSDPLNENAFIGKAKSLVSQNKRSEAIEVLSEGYSKIGSEEIWDYLQQLKQEERLEK